MLDDFLHQLVSGSLPSLIFSLMYLKTNLYEEVAMLVKVTAPVGLNSRNCRTENREI